MESRPVHSRRLLDAQHAIGRTIRRIWHDDHEIILDLDDGLALQIELVLDDEKDAEVLVAYTVADTP